MLSKKEWDYLHDQDFLLTKWKIQQTIQQSLQGTRDMIKSYISENPFDFPPFVDIQIGKISKGENYKSLPYLVLDFPKGFQKPNIWTFRTMVWWGNEISTSLLLKGSSLQHVNINDQYLSEIPKLFVGVNTSPWEYYFKEDNLVPIQSLNISLTEHVAKLGYLKLSFKHSLSSLEKLPKLALQDYITLLKAFESGC